VSVAPEERRITVFKRGKCMKGIGEMPAGGQLEPSSILGEREQWR